MCIFVCVAIDSKMSANYMFTWCKFNSMNECCLNDNYASNCNEYASLFVWQLWHLHCFSSKHNKNTLDTHLALKWAISRPERLRNNNTNNNNNIDNRGLLLLLEASNTMRYFSRANCNGNHQYQLTMAQSRAHLSNCHSTLISSRISSYVCVFVCLFVYLFVYLNTHRHI